MEEIVTSIFNNIVENIDVYSYLDDDYIEDWCEIPVGEFIPKFRILIKGNGISILTRDDNDVYFNVHDMITEMKEILTSIPGVVILQHQTCESVIHCAIILRAKYNTQTEELYLKMLREIGTIQCDIDKARDICNMYHVELEIL